VSNTYPANWAETSDRPFLEDSLTLAVQRTIELNGAACGKSEDPEYLAHLNAPNIARDLDLVRNLTGYETIDYYGLDYGTVIGITYTALFPDRVGHMLLDGNSNLMDILNFLAVVDFEKRMGITGNALDYAFEERSNYANVFHEFAVSCINATKINSESCPFAIPSMEATDPATDIVNRINDILTELANNGAYNYSTDGSYTYSNTAGQIGHTLSFPETWSLVASRLLSHEILIQNDNKLSHSKRDQASNSDMLFSSFNLNDPFHGQANHFINAAVRHLDSSYENIDDVNSFVQYISAEAEQNGFTAYRSLDIASGLGWPDLTAHNIERFTGPFPNEIKNKILIVAGINYAEYSYTSTLKTYKFLGPNNAVYFTHDGFGYNFTMDLNDCTMEMIMVYFANGGNTSLIKAHI
jgi:hypothetical protein